MEQDLKPNKCLIIESLVNVMDKEYDLKYVRSIIKSLDGRPESTTHAVKCVESVINRLWERIDKSEHALKHVLTMQVEMQENIVKLNKWLTPKETEKCPIQD
jgi:hypothetical protein